MIAIVFPGQGSQTPGMGKHLYERFPSAKLVFEKVSKAVGQDIARLCFESDAETLRKTQNAQLALYTCGLGAFATLKDSLPRGSNAFAGHSVGEYAALAASGLLDMRSGATLVQRRGELMAASGSGRPGTMAAVLGMEREALEAVCRRASQTDNVAVIANDNCPGQLVISGDTAAVQRASSLASEGGAKRVLPLNVSGAFHSPLMEDAAKAMGEALVTVTFNPSSSKVYSNVTSEAENDSASWRSLLESQLRSPVRWTESIEHMIRDGVDTFVECGAGEVLCGLIRRISKEVRTFAVFDSESLAKTVVALVAEGATA